MVEQIGIGSLTGNSQFRRIGVQNVCFYLKQLDWMK